MPYVDKKNALRYLSNPNDFNTYKAMFSKMYNNKLVEKIKNYKENNSANDLYDVVNNVYNIALNIGSNVLYDEASNILNMINRGEIESISIESIIDVIEQVKIELDLIK